MKETDLLASLAIHVTVFGAVMIAGLPQLAPKEDSGPVPIFFEVVEEAEAGATVHPEATPAPLEPPEAQESPEAQEPSADPQMEPEPQGEEAAPLEETDLPPEEATEPPEEEPPSPSDEPAQSSEGETSPPEDVEQEERASIVSDPIALNRIVPVYPHSARRKGHEGSVTVEISISKDGAVSSAEVVSSSGHAELDAAALGAVRTARFAPATEDGVSVSGRLRLTFGFRLK